jgi:hypothetical protein
MGAMTVKIMGIYCCRFFGCGVNLHSQSVSFDYVQCNSFFTVLATVYCEKNHILNEEWVLLLVLCILMW